MMKLFILTTFLILVLSNDTLKFNGRWQKINDSYLADWPGTSLKFSILGASNLKLQLGEIFIGPCQYVQYRLNVYFNGILVRTLDVYHQIEDQVIDILYGIDSKQKYEVEIRKITEAFQGQPSTGTCGPWSLKNILTDGQILKSNQPTKQYKMLFFGASLTVGYGVDGKNPCSFTAQTENNDHSHAKLIADYFDAELNVLAWSGQGVCRNFAEPTQKSDVTMIDRFRDTLALEREYKYNLNQYIPDFVSINIGTNDYSTQPWPEDADFIIRLSDFVINDIHGNYPNAKILIGCGPMSNKNTPYCPNVKAAVALVRYKLGDDIVRYADLENILVLEDLGCDTHPNQIGQQKIALVLQHQIEEWLVQKKIQLE